MFQYRKAICREIPKSIIENGLRMETEETPLNYDVAVKQHTEYIEALKSLGITVTVLESDESTPDCVFVEDTAVVVGNTVVITSPGAPSRMPETTPIKKYFEMDKYKTIVVMEKPASLDGGDVLFTGYEIFVGKSSRTNTLGIGVLREAFKDIPVHTVNISNKSLHLKSMMTMVADGIILCGSSKDSNDAIAQVLGQSTKPYSVIRTPVDAAANCVVVNGTVICRSEEEFPGSHKALEILPINKTVLSGTELHKVDGALTCCSILHN